MATGDVATQPYSFRDRESAQRLTKNTWKVVMGGMEKKKSQNFLLLLMGIRDRASA